jgi:hypothetical protein
MNAAKRSSDLQGPAGQQNARQAVGLILFSQQRDLCRIPNSDGRSPVKSPSSRQSSPGPKTGLSMDSKAAVGLAALGAIAFGSAMAMATAKGQNTAKNSACASARHASWGEKAAEHSERRCSDGENSARQIAPACIQSPTRLFGQDECSEVKLRKKYIMRTGCCILRVRILAVSNNVT